MNQPRKYNSDIFSICNKRKRLSKTVFLEHYSLSPSPLYTLNIPCLGRIPTKPSAKNEDSGPNISTGTITGTITGTMNHTFHHFLYNEKMHINGSELPINYDLLPTTRHLLVCEKNLKAAALLHITA